MNKYFVLLLLLINRIGYTQKYSDEYNFDFKFSNSFCWGVNPSMPYVKSDTIDGVSNRICRFSPLSIDVIGKPFLYPLNFELSQDILLPEEQNNELEVNLISKSNIFGKALLYVTTFDNNENLLLTDSAIINSSMERLTTSTLNISINNAVLIKIGICVRGNNDSTQFVELNNISVKIDNKNIDDYLLNTGFATDIEKDKVSFFSTDSDIALNNLFQNKRIIALGENMHGTKTLNRQVYQIAKERILNGKCKLVLIEFPLESLLKWNYFVTNELELTIDDLKEDFPLVAFSLEDLYSFMCWIKNYNKDQVNKVTLLGMDVSMSRMDNWLSFADYLFYINQKLNNPLLDRYSRSILRNDSVSVVLQELEKYEDLALCIGLKNYKILLYALNNRLKLNEILSHSSKLMMEHLSLRDSVMAKNVLFLHGTCCAEDESVVLFGHFEHIKRGGNISVDNRLRSTGQILSDIYGDDYFALAIWGGKGKTIQRKTDLQIVCDLQERPGNNFEHQFSSMKYPYCLIPKEAFPEKMILARCIGFNFYLNNQFQYRMLYGKVDAVLFVNKVEPLNNNSVLNKAEASRNRIFRIMKMKLDRQ